MDEETRKTYFAQGIATMQAAAMPWATPVHRERAIALAVACLEHMPLIALEAACKAGDFETARLESVGRVLQQLAQLVRVLGGVLSEEQLDLLVQKTSAVITELLAERP